MKYNFTVVANRYEKLIVDNMEIEFYRHIQNGSMDGKPVVWNRMAVSVKVLDDDGNVIGKKATGDLYNIGDTNFRIGTDLLIDIIDYDTEPVEVAVCDREYFGINIWCNASDGKVSVTVETGLGKYLNTGCGAISKIYPDKMPPSVKSYNLEG